MPAEAEAQTTDTEFAIKDCALIAIATGKKAHTLNELLDTLLNIDLGSIYYHFWGGLLEARFEEREFNNDFAGWAKHGIHDSTLAERLAVIDPTEFMDLEELRQEIVTVIEQRLDETEYLPWVRATKTFEFIRSQIVVFDTRRRVRKPEELVGVMPAISPSSVFYHFIDARRRLPDGTDDLRAWLLGFGEPYEPLRARLADIDPYFSTLPEIRDQLARTLAVYFEESTP